MLGIFTIPFVLSFILETSEGISLPPGPMLQTLVQQILIPLFIGVVIRLSSPALRNLVDGNRKAVQMLSTAFLVTVPWMQISQAAASKPDLAVWSLGATFLLGLGVHALYLLGNTAAASALRLGGPDGKAYMTQKVRRAVILTTRCDLDLQAEHEREWNCLSLLRISSTGIQPFQMSVCLNVHVYLFPCMFECDHLHLQPEDVARGRRRREQGGRAARGHVGRRGATVRDEPPRPDPDGLVARELLDRTGPEGGDRAREAGRGVRIRGRNGDDTTR